MTKFLVDDEVRVVAAFSEFFDMYGTIVRFQGKNNEDVIVNLSGEEYSFLGNELGLLHKR